LLHLFPRNITALSTRPANCFEWREWGIEHARRPFDSQRKGLAMMQLRFCAPLRAITIIASLLGAAAPSLAATFSEEGASVFGGVNYNGRRRVLPRFDVKRPPTLA
jgi:hypothetical protein